MKSFFDAIKAARQGCEIRRSDLWYIWDFEEQKLAYRDSPEDRADILITADLMDKEEWEIKLPEPVGIVEAVKMMKVGQNMRRTDWPENDYVFIYKMEFYDQDDNPYGFAPEDFKGENWVNRVEY